MVAEAFPQGPSQKLENLLKSFEGRRVLVLGDLGVDRYTYGTVERISPEAPVPVVQVERESLKLGLASNVAENLRTLGGEPILLGVVGNDADASDLIDLLRRAKLPTDGVVVEKGRRTTLKERILSEGQQVVRVDYESDAPMRLATQHQVMKRFDALLEEADAVIVQDYAKGLLSLDVAQHVFRQARRRQKPIFVDPNAKSPPRLYRGATVLTPNRKEAEALSGMPLAGKRGYDLRGVGERIFQITRCEQLVLTLGKDGMAVFSDATKRPRVIPTFAREVYDVSGAGDTVIAALALALAGGAKLEDAAVLANIAAGIVVGKRGTATVSPREILSLTN